MPAFDIVKEIDPKNTFRVQSIINTFDLPSAKVREHFKGSIDIENVEWNIGIIYGSSGTGKSTIANEVFKGNVIREFEYKSPCFLDDMPKENDMKTITQALGSVGFSSPPSWLKPYSVLSNGEKMRCDLARAILENKELIVFDEFTSVVDRTVAKVGSAAIAKMIRGKHKKFVAVSCRDDIVEWLAPDWVFNTNTMEFKFTRGLLQRPKIHLSIHEVSRSYWQLFRKYHYLNSNILSSSKSYCAFIDEKPVAFCSITRFVHGKVKNAMRGHRTVVLPDYQGLGIGVSLSDFVADLVLKSGERFISTTSSPAMIFFRKKSSKWRCTHIGRCAPGSGSGEMSKTSSSSNRLTSSWEYIG